MSVDRNIEISGYPVIILAGGNGARMPAQIRHVPKATLIAYDEPLVVQIIKQIREAECGDDIVISTSPKWYKQISDITAHIISGTGRLTGSPGRGVNIRVLMNRAHCRGPLPALSLAIKTVKANRCLMCLGDIYFRSNPFYLFAGDLDPEVDYLGVREVYDPGELRTGGLVYCAGDEVRVVSERRRASRFHALRWSGITLFGAGLRRDLTEFLTRFPDTSALGDFCEFRRRAGRRVQVLEVSEFVNVNTREHLLLANLYAAMESYSRRSSIYWSLERVTNELRRKILRRSD
ncbi:MAG: NTP transferase domain-containing protein [Blastocatellia bacterium]